MPTARKSSPIAPETLDGITFGLRLMASPAVAARNRLFTARLRHARAMLAQLSRERLEAAATTRRLITLPGAFARIEDADLCDRIARCLFGKDGALWVTALGLAQNPIDDIQGDTQ